VSRNDEVGAAGLEYLDLGAKDLEQLSRVAADRDADVVELPW